MLKAGETPGIGLGYWGDSFVYMIHSLINSFRRLKDDKREEICDKIKTDDRKEQLRKKFLYFFVCFYHKRLNS